MVSHLCVLKNRFKIGVFICGYIGRNAYIVLYNVTSLAANRPINCFNLVQSNK